MKTKIYNSAKPASAKPSGPIFQIRNKADATKPLEILIYDEIGKDSWTGEGFDAKDFAKAIDGVDKSREIHVRLNSRGGIVDDGIAIYNRLKEWPAKTVAKIDGSAASIASVIAMGCTEIEMPKSAEMLIHEAHGVAYGDSKDFSEMASRLDSASNRIAGIYSQRTGKSIDEMRNYMRKTSVFNGEEAKNLGLCDTLTDEVPIYNLTPEDIENFRVQPGKQDKKPDPAAAPKIENTMRKKIIEMLNKKSIKFEESATDEQLLALLETQPENKSKTDDKPAVNPDAERLRNIEARLENERRTRITNEIDKLVNENRLPGAIRDKAIARAIADETVLDEYRALTPVLPGTEPAGVEITSEDPKAVSLFLTKNFGGHVKDVSSARADGITRAEVWNKYEKKLMPLLNANNVDSALKRVAILQGMIRAFARRLAPLSAFSTVYNGVVLQGTGQVVVPYFPLDTTASKDFVQATGYVFNSDANAQSKTVNVSQAAGGYRKYQDFKFNSDDFRRQPYLDTVQLFALKGEALAADVFKQTLSIVTQQNFGLPVKTKAAVAFNANDISDIKGACTRANWPDAGRTIIIDSDYEAALTKDSQITGSLDPATAEVVRTGKLPPLKGFDIFSVPTIPDNGQNLKGMAVFKSAILWASAPIEPTPEVRALMTTYEVIVDPQTGAAFEFRRWGNPDADETRQVIECNFGYGLGETAALKIIASA